MMALVNNINWNDYCVIIPAYNSESTLPVLINKLQRLYPQLDILVIDDGSQKDLQKNIHNKIWNFIRHNRNRGKGAALKRGIKHAQKKGKNYAIFLDSDLQHKPEAILRFVYKQLKSRSSIILGKRNFTDKMPFHRVLSNTITSFLISLRTGTRIHDSQCGFRLLELNNINTDNYNYNGFQFESEFLLKTIDSSTSISEVEISTIYNDHDSNMENFMDTIRFIKMYFASFLWR